MTELSEQELKLNWKIASKIAWLHFRFSSRATGLIMAVGLIVTAIILSVRGYHVTPGFLIDYVIQQKKTIILALAASYFLPINIYAMWRVLQHPYKNFKIKFVVAQAGEGKPLPF